MKASTILCQGKRNQAKVQLKVRRHRSTNIKVSTLESRWSLGRIQTLNIDMSRTMSKEKIKRRTFTRKEETTHTRTGDQTHTTRVSINGKTMFSRSMGVGKVPKRSQCRSNQRKNTHATIIKGMRSMDPVIMNIGRSLGGARTRCKNHNRNLE